MNEHDFLSLHAAKALEYFLGALYLVCFVPLWRFINGPATAAESRAAFAARDLVDWFRVPDGFHLHPGHAWANAEGPGSVAVGLDDFGHRLVGPMSCVLAPAVGQALRKGEPAFTVVADGKRFDLLSGEAASRFLEAAADRLMPRMQPAMVLAQDGGAPVHGIARELDPEHWDDTVRSAFLTR